MEDTARKLARYLGALESDDLRSAAAARLLLEHSPPEAVLIVSALARWARDSSTAATALAMISRTLAKGLIEPEFVASCLQAARSRADRALEAIFAIGPARRQYDRNEEAFSDRRMNAIPLGRRRALSRSKDIDLLVRLAHDQDPKVIEQLLTNPRLTEREAMLIASRRPTRPDILHQVLASRFGTRGRIKAAVAHNPYSPVTLAVRAMAGLSAVELSALADDEKLAVAVRRHARSLMVLRRSTPAQRDRAANNPLIDADAHPELEALLEQLAPDDGDEEPQLIID